MEITVEVVCGIGKNCGARVPAMLDDACFSEGIV